MALYRVQATLELTVSQSGLRPAQARNNEDAIAAVLAEIVTTALLGRAMRDRIYRAAGAGDDINDVIGFRVLDVSET